MSKIYKYHLSYALLREYFMFSFRRFFSEYIVTGKENIPGKGPVIFAANHINALMDPLAVISVIPKKLPIIYMGRSDYFKGRRIKKFLHLIKMIPAYRMRDGIENLEKNRDSFEQCNEVLKNNLALGIMPEGNQGPYRRIRPLVKGIFRIAFRAQEKYGLQPGVKIIPVGIDYNEFDKFGQKIIINIGKPIEVSDFMQEYYDNQINAINIIRDKLRDDLRNLTLNIDTTEHYDSFETAIEIANTHVTTKLGKGTDSLSRFRARQKITGWLKIFEKKEPEIVNKMDQLCSEYRENLKKLRFRSWLFDSNQINFAVLFIKALLLLITSPVFITGLLLNVLPFFLPELVRKIFKIHFPGGLSSLRFLLGLISFPVFYIIQAIYLYKKFETSLLGVLIFIPLQYLTGKFSFSWYRNFRKLSATFRFLKLKSKKDSLLIRTQQIHEEIIQLIQTV